MKALALITAAGNTDVTQWQFNKIMAAIAYDLELNIVFMCAGVEQLTNNKIWKCLELYGVENIFVLEQNLYTPQNYLFGATKIDTNRLQQLIQLSDIIIP
ncbi:hypothetical protein MNBD_GAMMA01-1580 [hydrothermal vent metagenome]|uniref:Uncharacterized protein n=1 Tax=hydrothermal vent metagenome TaxID=652676 RepID=A0A3B0V670_9ZZZZ